MNEQQRKRIRELGRYAVTVAREEGLPAMASRTAGFVRRRFFGKKARYLPGKKVHAPNNAAQGHEIARGAKVPVEDRGIPPGDVVGEASLLGVAACRGRAKGKLLR